MSNSKLLQSVDQIMERWQISEKQFYMLVRLGLPARKINGRWYAHDDNIDEFFRYILRPGKPLDQDDENIDEFKI